MAALYSAIGISLLSGLLFFWRRPKQNSWQTPLLSGLVTCAALGFLAIVLHYLFGSITYRDHAEATITMVSYGLSQGAPLWTPLDSAPRYATVYGPLLYLYNLLFLKLLPANLIFASKLAGILATVGGLTALTLTTTKKRNWHAAAVLLAYSICVFLLFDNNSFWNRTESLIVLFTCLACCSVLLDRERNSLLLLAVSLAALANTRINSPAYALAVVPLFIAKFGYKSFFTLVLISAVLFALPYLAVPKLFNVSHFTDWLLTASTHGLSSKNLSSNVAFSRYVLLPLILVVGIYLPIQDVRRALWTPIAASVACYGILLAVITVMAAKDGSGPYHLLPFAPVGMLLALELRTLLNSQALVINAPFKQQTLRLLHTGVVMLVAFFGVRGISAAIRSQTNLYTAIVTEQGQMAQAKAELEAILQRYPAQTLEMGYTDNDNYAVTFLRPLLLQTVDTPYMLDAPILMDTTQAGFELPQATIDYYATQQVDLIVLPVTGAPYTLTSLYRSQAQIFDDDLRAAIAENYAVLYQGDVYQVLAAR